MTEEQILNQRDPNREYYSSITELKSQETSEFVDYYGTNILWKDNAYFNGYTSNRMFVLNATLDFETGDYVISVENMDPFIVEDGINHINKDFRIIRINLLSKTYQSHSEDIFTKNQKEDFINFINQNWISFRDAIFKDTVDKIVTICDYKYEYRDEYDAIIRIFGKNITNIDTKDIILTSKDSFPNINRSNEVKLYQILDNIIPENCPDFSSLPVKD